MKDKCLQKRNVTRRELLGKGGRLIASAAAMKAIGTALLSAQIVAAAKKDRLG
jgi:hypothetical protein